MSAGNTRRFHLLAGPDTLFEYSRRVLRDWTAGGLDISQEHIQARIGERELDIDWFERFDYGDYQIVTIDLKVKRRDPGYMAIRRRIDERRWLWVILVHEVVVTAYVRNNAKIPKVSERIVQDGPFFDSVAQRFADKLRVEIEAEKPVPQPLYLEAKPAPPTWPRSAAEGAAKDKQTRWDRIKVWARKVLIQRLDHRA